MPTPENIETSAKAILLKTIVSLCQHRDLLKVDFLQQGNSVLVQITAHPTDSKIIVGSGGSHISALARLARLLFHGSRKMVQIMPVESLEGYGKENYRKLNPTVSRHDSIQLCLQAKEIVENVFRGCYADAKCVPSGSNSSKLIVTVMPRQNEIILTKLADAMFILFVPIGAACGHIVYADVKNK